jgi:hypothetical protein
MSGNGHLPRLESDRSHELALQRSKLEQDLLHLCAIASSSEVAGRSHVLLEEGEDQSVLASDTVVRLDLINDCLQVVIGLLAKHKDHVCLSSEAALGRVVLVEQRGVGGGLVCLQSTTVLFEQLGQRIQSGLDLSPRRRFDRVLEESVDNFAETSSREFGASLLGGLDVSSEGLFQACRHTARKGRQDSLGLSVRQARVSEEFTKLCQCGMHGEALIETIEYVVQHLEHVREALFRLLSYDDRQSDVWKLTTERLGVLDLRWVIESENTENISLRDRGTGGLDP